MAQTERRMGPRRAEAAVSAAVGAGEGEGPGGRPRGTRPLTGAPGPRRHTGRACALTPVIPTHTTGRCTRPAAGPFLHAVRAGEPVLPGRSSGAERAGHAVGDPAGGGTGGA